MYSMQMLLPALDAFELCWRDTDALFATMPDWSVQPISMRHPFGFYYGELLPPESYVDVCTACCGPSYVCLFACASG